MSEIAISKKIGKESFKDKMPPGAKILQKEIRVEVEEIENGFLICKRYEIKYKVEKSVDWCYCTKKYFSKEDPLQIDTENKALSDLFS